LKTVSIVIPCLNEKNYILKCLSSVVAQSYPQPLITTYVCDGMSNDGTRELIAAFAKQHPQFTLLDNSQRTTPFALNLGIKASIADIIIILGAHSELDENFVLKSVESFDLDPAIMCTGGVLENVYENKTSRTIGAAMSSSFGVGNAHFRTGNKSGFVDTVAFGAYKKEIFEKVGFFDEELIRNQDDEFNFRVTNAGYKIYLNQEIKCRYFVRASFQKLYKQYYQYGYWKVFVNKKHRTITTVRQLIPMFFVLYLFCLMISLLLPIIIFQALSAFGVLYSLLALTFALKAAKNSPDTVFGVVFTFFILHFSYGLGYLKGIFDFFILGKSIKKHESLSR
jgi:cellulose synthase/poly-beta-1,6-N-acetylglucosamine synthase-like glycosyltransferase